MITNFFLIAVSIAFSLIVASLAIFTFFKNKNPIVKIIVSGFLLVLMASISLMLTTVFDYNLSYLVDIIVIYFILGFANFVLYFVFFNKRS